MKRRPFFLLEVLIATVLVGVFAYFSIHGSFNVIYRQKKMLQELSTARINDAKRIDLVAMYWNEAKSLVKKPVVHDNYKVSCLEAKKDKYYLLTIKDKKAEESFSYFVSKQS